MKSIQEAFILCSRFVLNFLTRTLFYFIIIIFFLLSPYLLLFLSLQCLNLGQLHEIYMKGGLFLVAKTTVLNMQIIRLFLTTLIIFFCFLSFSAFELLNLQEKKD